MVSKETVDIDVVDEDFFVERNGVECCAKQPKASCRFGQRSIEEPLYESSAIVVISIVSEQNTQIASAVHKLDQRPRRSCDCREREPYSIPTGDPVARGWGV